jgi:hypothetical protein
MKYSPAVEQAKAICKQNACTGVIVLCFDGYNVSGASYGVDGRRCKEYGKTLDNIVDAIESGKVKVG